MIIATADFLKQRKKDFLKKKINHGFMLNRISVKYFQPAIFSVFIILHFALLDNVVHTRRKINETIVY